MSKSGVTPDLKWGVKSKNCVQFWLTHFKKGIAEMKKVQKRATKIIKGLEWLPYEARLHRFEGLCLEKIQLRGDMIGVYTIMHGVEK